MKKRFIIPIVIVFSVLLIIELVHLLFFKGLTDIGYIEKYTGLDLSEDYESEDMAKRGSSVRIIKYTISEGSVDEVKEYITDNWKGKKNDKIPSYIPKNPQNDIEKQLQEDEEYCTGYSFMWTPDTGAKTEEMKAIVVEKADEMYIVFYIMD